MRKMLIIFSGLFVLLLVSAVFVFGQTAEEHILKGDEYYAQFDNKKALEEYRQGDCSLAYAAKQAGVSLWEMIPFAYAYGLSPRVDPDLLEADLTLEQVAQL